MFCMRLLSLHGRTFRGHTYIAPKLSNLSFLYLSFGH